MCKYAVHQKVSQHRRKIKVEYERKLYSQHGYRSGKYYNIFREIVFGGGLAVF